MYYDSYYVDGLENKDVSRRFLRTILSYSDAFSLIYFKYRQNEKVSMGTAEIRKGLSKYILNSCNVTEWPGTKILSNNQNHIYCMKTYRIDYFKMLPVFERVETLWAWDYPNYPMDPCFYKNGYAWFAVSTHEHWNELYLGKSTSYPLASDLESLGVSLISQGKADEAKLYKHTANTPR